MKIAVTGASGFVGSNLVEELSKHNFKLNLIARSDKLERFKSDKIAIFKGSVDDVDSLLKAFNGCDIIFHLVGIIVETKTNSFEKTVAQGTKNVIEAAEKSNVKKIVYVSALGTSENARTAYHRTKYIAEKTIIESSLDYVILRPSLIFGPGDGFVTMLVDIIKKAPLTPITGHGKYLLQPIYIGDLTKACVKLLETPDAWGKIIDIAGEERLEYRQILNIIKSVLKINRPNFYIPMAVMKFIGSVLEKIMKPAPVTKDQMIMLEMGNVGDITVMKELLEVEPKKFEDELKKYLR